MPEQDSLRTTDFSSFGGGGGLYLKFTPGKPVTIRILTTDPVISESEFTDKGTGEVKVNTRFAFIVYNFTDSKAQIMQVTPKTAERISQIHLDEAYGADVKKIDIRITPPEKGEIKAYLLEVMPNTHQLTQEQVDEARGVDLDNNIKDSRGRMSSYNQDMAGNQVGSGGSGYEKAKAQAAALKPSQEPVPDDIGDQPINLDDIPF